MFDVSQERHVLSGGLTMLCLRAYPVPPRILARATYCVNLAILAACMTTTPFSEGSEPTSEHLITLLPKIKSGIGGPRQILIRGSVLLKENPEYEFLVIHSAPNHFTLFVSDPRDGVPIAYANDNECLVYSVVDNCIIYIRPSTFLFSLDFTRRKFVLEMELTKATTDSRVRLDSSGLFEGGDLRSRKVEALGANTFRMSDRSAEGGVAAATFDLSEPNALRRIELRRAGEAPFLRIEECSYDNNKPTARWPSFPTVAELRLATEVKDLSNNNLTNNLLVTAMLPRAFEGLFALRVPGRRLIFDRGHGGRTNWAMCESSYRHNSPRIKKAIEPFLNDFLAKNPSANFKARLK